MPIWLGRLGREKTEIAREFVEHVAGKGLRCDVSSREDDRIYGEGWNRFLASCRTTLGTESGASIVDFDGSIETLAKDYLARRPDATPEEIERDLTGPYEGKVVINTASPRLFEARGTPHGHDPVQRDPTAEWSSPGGTTSRSRRTSRTSSEVVERVRDPGVPRRASRTAPTTTSSPRAVTRCGQMVGEFDTLVAERARALGRRPKDSYRRARRRPADPERRQAFTAAVPRPDASWRLSWARSRRDRPTETSDAWRGPASEHEELCATC